MKTHSLSIFLSIIIILAQVACSTSPAVAILSPTPTEAATETSAPTLTPTIEPTPVPSYLGEFSDISVQQFIGEIGPGYTNNTLVNYDNTIAYDPYLSVPIWISLDLHNHDHTEYNANWKTRLSLGTPVNVAFSMENIPDTPDNIRYDTYNLMAGVISWQDVSMKIKVENARIELPDETILLPQNNGIFDAEALNSSRFDPRGNWLFTGFGPCEVTLPDLPDTRTLKKGYFKADVTLLEADGPGKADYYTDKGLVEFEPALTSEWFSFLKSQGFNSIRFQVTWFNHTNDETYEIDPEWLAKVQEKIDLALENDLYVSINLNWDMCTRAVFTNGLSPQEIAALPSDHAWLTLDGDPQVEERFAAVWTQIAEYFKDYDEHLIFESINEPIGTDETMAALGAIGDPNGRGWSYVGRAGDNLNRLNQIFVDSVRATGGNNAQRFLFVPPFFSKAKYLDQFVLPEDPAQHVIVKMHYYQGDFAIGGGDPFPNIKKYLTDNQIAAVLTEFGSSADEYSEEERIPFVQEAVVQAKELNVPIIWFAGGWGNIFEITPDFCLYNPYTQEVVFPELVDLLMSK